MRVLITGAAGMIGQRLARRLLADRRIGSHPISELVLHDIATPEIEDKGSDDGEAAMEEAEEAMPVVREAADLGDPGAASELMALPPDVIFHLASVVSGEAEEDFEKGYRVNLVGTTELLEAARAAGNVPRFVFASSIAVFGRPFPEPIPDDWPLRPLTSYGTQKAMVELLIDDYSRKGAIDGIGLRLPTIIVRPGAPNQAASSFFSSIIREPLAGEEAILPVGDELRHWFASPDAAVGFLLHAARLETHALGHHRSLTMPGLSATVAELIAALEAVAGSEPVSRIRREPDPEVQAIVEGWPTSFEAGRARALGFEPDASLEAIIRAHIEGG